jgi:hypothetical protein
LLDSEAIIRSNPWEIGFLETERIVQGLISRTLPKLEWTHQAHLRAGLWHVLRYPNDMALNLLRERIRAFNEASGVANTANSGYHETITRFYVHMIRSFLETVDPSLDVDVLADALITRHGDKNLPLRYFTTEVLFSPAARLLWVVPDVQPLPEIKAKAES